MAGLCEGHQAKSWAFQSRGLTMKRGTKTGMAITHWAWPSQSTLGHCRHVSLRPRLSSRRQNQNQPPTYTQLRAGRHPKLLGQELLAQSHIPQAWVKSHPGAETLLFCGHQGEVFRAEADGEVGERLLGPGQVAHQVRKRSGWPSVAGAVPADQEPAGEGQAAGRREGLAAPGVRTQALPEALSCCASLSRLLWL